MNSNVAAVASYVSQSGGGVCWVTSSGFHFLAAIENASAGLGASAASTSAYVRVGVRTCAISP